MRTIVIPARPAREVQEVIVAVSFNDLRKTMQIGICEMVADPGGEMKPDESTLRYEDVDYDRVMKADKKTGRPPGEFRRDDLFDLIKDNKT